MTGDGGGVGDRTGLSLATRVNQCLSVDVELEKQRFVGRGRWHAAGTSHRHRILNVKSPSGDDGSCCGGVTRERKTPVLSHPPSHRPSLLPAPPTGPPNGTRFRPLGPALACFRRSWLWRQKLGEVRWLRQPDTPRPRRHPRVGARRRCAADAQAFPLSRRARFAGQIPEDLTIKPRGAGIFFCEGRLETCGEQDKSSGCGLRWAPARAWRAWKGMQARTSQLSLPPC